MQTFTNTKEGGIIAVCSMLVLLQCQYLVIGSHVQHNTLTNQEMDEHQTIHKSQILEG